MIYLYLFGTCFHFIYVFMIIGKKKKSQNNKKRILSRNKNVYIIFSPTFLIYFKEILNSCTD